MQQCLVNHCNTVVTSTGISQDGFRPKTEEKGKPGGGGGGGGMGKDRDVERGRMKFESLWHQDGTLTSI